MRLLTAALVCAAVPAMAQDPRTRTWWGFISLGPGGAVDSGFYASGVGAAIQRGRKVHMLRVSSLDTPDYKRISDAGLLIGVGGQPRRLHSSFAAGVSIVTDRADSTALGLPIEWQVGVLLGRRLALGGRVFGCFNRLANYGGVGLNLQFGRFR